MYDFKSQLLQPDHLKYFLDYYSEYPDLLNISNKLNNLEDHIISTQLFAQYSQYSLDKDFNDFFKENAAEIDASMRSFVRITAAAGNELGEKVYELMFQYVLKVKYL